MKLNHPEAVAFIAAVLAFPLVVALVLAFASAGPAAEAPGHAAPGPRQDQPAPAPSAGARFSQDVAGVVTDRLTGLQWSLSQGGFDWNKARAWVESLDAAGGGWRMPVREELAGLRTKSRARANAIPFLS